MPLIFFVVGTCINTISLYYAIGISNRNYQNFPEIVEYRNTEKANRAIGEFLLLLLSGAPTSNGDFQEKDSQLVECED